MRGRGSAGPARQGLEELPDDQPRRGVEQAAADLAAAANADLWVVECVADEDDLRERLRRREARGESISDGRWGIFERERAAFEPMDEVPAARHVVVRTTGKPVRESVSFALQHLGLYRWWK